MTFVFKSKFKSFQSECRMLTRDTQAIELDSGFADIAYGFLIGGRGEGRGFVIEGRGFDYQAEYQYGTV